MFKDYDKYLTTSLKVYLFVLIIIFIMKIVGLDYFGLDTNNPIIIKIANLIEIYNIDFFINTTLLYFYSYVMMSITVKCNDKSIKIFSLFMTMLGIIVQIILFKYNLVNLKTIIDIIIWIIFLILIKNKHNIKRFIIVLIFNILFQYISVLTRSNNNILYLNNTIIELILNLDYILLMLISYKICFNKGGNGLCGQEVGSYSLKKLNLKKSLKRLQKNWFNFKKQDKVSKITYIIYFILSLIWNIFSIFVVLLVARLNDTFIECIFILTSFWLSKKAFGKAFHLKSMAHCFVVSNLTYYTLNRITTPIGISIIIPIMLGVGLSYVTSKLVKKKYKPLYKGMPEELFEETILKVTDKNSVKYKICYDFYIKNKSVVSLALKYNYSEVGIRKIKDRINNKIKGLE